MANNNELTADRPTSLGISRRRALKGSGATILGSFSLLSEGGGRSPSTVKLPMLVSGDKVVKYLEVPADWNQHRRHATDVLRRVRDRLERVPGVVGTELGQSSQTFGGHGGLKIYALVTDEYGPKSELPSEVEGIEVAVERAPDVYPGCSGPGSSDNCTNSEDDKIIQGGEIVGWANGSYGTSTIKVNYDGSEHLLHCGHVFWSDCTDAESGGLTDRTAQANGTKIGETVAVDVKGDWSTIDTSHGGDYRYKIDDNDTFPTIAGYVTKSTLDHWASISSDPCVRQMGTTTGKTYGKTYRTNADFTNWDCTNMRNEGVRTKCNFGDGDSGGPTWHLHNGDAYMISCTGYFYNADGYACDLLKGRQSAGIGAYWLKSNTPMDFAGNATV